MAVKKQWNIDVQTPDEIVRKVNEDFANGKHNEFFNRVDPPKTEIVRKLPTTQLREFGLHPFKVLVDRDMAELVESIRSDGIMVPLIVREQDNSKGYQIISGHRRKRAAELLGLTEVPVTIKNLGDDEAVAYMVDTNLSRTHILPSEKAWAYKMKLDAMKRKAGRQKNGVPLANNSDPRKSREILQTK